MFGLLFLLAPSNIETDIDTDAYRDNEVFFNSTA